MPYNTNSSVEAIAGELLRARRVLVTSHAKPDGDAMGSVLAVVRACQAAGVDAEGWVVDPCEGNLRAFEGPTKVVHVNPRAPVLPGDGFDLGVVVDTGAWAQLEHLSPWLRAMAGRVVGLDHHARGDEVAARRVVEVGCGSCTALVVRLVDAMGVPMRAPGSADARFSIAEALYMGLATDTGWFRLPNARASEFALAARLLEIGVDKDGLYQQLEQSSRAERVELQARALSSLEILRGGTASMMTLRASDFDETGALLEETSGMVNMPMEIAALRVSALVVEDAPAGLIKMSFRSKPPDADGAFIDVNQMAGIFGGGGHVHAAGARAKDSLDAVRARVRVALSGS